MELIEIRIQWLSWRENEKRDGETDLYIVFF